MTSTQKGGEEVLKLVVCLRILLFLNNIFILHFCKWGWGWGVIFCERHNCMIPNVKKVMFLALVPVLK